MESEWNLVIPLLLSALVVSLEVVVQRLFVAEVVVVLEVIAHRRLVLSF